MTTIDTTIFLGFDIRREDKYQGIYYGHLLDSTVAIGALFKILEEENGLIKRFKANFISDILGGRINLALNDFAKKVKLDSGNNNVHQLFFSLDILEDRDDEFAPIEIEFEKPFNPLTDVLEVRPYEKFRERYTNYVNGMFASGPKEINDLRSCDVLIGNG